MATHDTYLTIRTSSEGLYKERGSKFFALARPVSNGENVKSILQELKKKYYDANHHCYAYVLGPKGDQYRASDDGEPGHSGGDPILGQIRTRNLTNTLVVVVRYFGGTKLGIPGLIHAYKSAASNALDNNHIFKKEITELINIQFDYQFINTVMRLVKALSLNIENQEMAEDCRITLRVRLGIADELKNLLGQMKGVKMIKGAKIRNV